MEAAMLVLNLEEMHSPFGDDDLSVPTSPAVVAADKQGDGFKAHDIESVCSKAGGGRERANGHSMRPHRLSDFDCGANGSRGGKIRGVFPRSDEMTELESLPGAHVWRSRCGLLSGCLCWH
jgi:hypothetical protein